MCCVFRSEATVQPPLLKDKFRLQSNTLHAFQREICRNDTLKLLIKTLLKELSTSKGEILSCKSVKPCKSRKKLTGVLHHWEQEINPVQIPHPSNATFKFPPPWARCFKCPGHARGGEDVEVSNWSAHYTVVVGGDFDVIFNQDLIGSGCIKRVKGSVTFLGNNYREHNLVDIWRVGNHTAKRFTWRQKNPLIQRR